MGIRLPLSLPLSSFPFPSPYPPLLSRSLFSKPTEVHESLQQSTVHNLDCLADYCGLLWTSDFCGLWTAGLLWTALDFCGFYFMYTVAFCGLLTAVNFYEQLWTSTSCILCTSVGLLWTAMDFYVMYTVDFCGLWTAMDGYGPVCDLLTPMEVCGLWTAMDTKIWENLKQHKPF